MPKAKQSSLSEIRPPMLKHAGQEGFLSLSLSLQMKREAMNTTFPGPPSKRKTTKKRTALPFASALTLGGGFHLMIPACYGNAQQILCKALGLNDFRVLWEHRAIFFKVFGFLMVSCVCACVSFGIELSQSVLPVLRKSIHMGTRPQDWNRSNCCYPLPTRR